MTKNIKWYWLIFTNNLVFTVKDLSHCKNDWDLDELYPWYSTAFGWSNLWDLIDYFESEYWFWDWKRNDFEKTLLDAAKDWRDLVIILGDYPELIIRDYSREEVVDSFEKEWKKFWYAKKQEIENRYKKNKGIFWKLFK